MLERIAPPDLPTAHRLYFTADLHGNPRAPQLEDSFFHSLVLRNGTFKTTWHHRLDDLNVMVEPFLPSGKPLEILDVAVSSGISTVEWLEFLDRIGIECHMTAGDAVIDAFLVTAGPLRGLFDRTWHLMQLEVRGQAVRMPQPRRRDRLRFSPLVLLVKAAARLGMPHRALKLVSPSLTAHPRIDVVEDDILNDRRWPRRFDVLRAANVLNRCYFNDGMLEKMLRNLRSRLAPRGLLIVCRTTEEGRNDATLFRLAEDRSFRKLATLNEGSEVAELVLSLPAENAQASALQPTA